MLSLVIGNYLYSTYPGTDEGFLSQMRAKVVNREFFNNLGFELGLDKFLEENSSMGFHYEIVPSMVGNCFEALFGAIFLDQGYKKCQLFFEKVILAEYLDIEQIKQTDTNYKSRLLEWCQKDGKSLEFKHVHTTREGTQLVFSIEVLVEGKVQGKGEGFQKKKAEQLAAKNALENLGVI